MVILGHQTQAILAMPMQLVKTTDGLTGKLTCRPCATRPTQPTRPIQPGAAEQSTPTEVPERVLDLIPDPLAIHRLTPLIPALAPRMPGIIRTNIPRPTWQRWELQLQAALRVQPLVWLVATWLQIMCLSLRPIRKMVMQFILRELLPCLHLAPEVFKSWRMK